MSLNPRYRFLLRGVAPHHSGCTAKLTWAHHSLCALQRHKSYNFYVNLEDPEETLRHVEEEKARLEQEGKQETTAYLHQELNEALALYQVQDFIHARSKAEEVHEKVLQRNGFNSSLTFFTSKTASFCCDALADAYERHLTEKEAHIQHPSSLAPPPSLLFQARRAISKLRADAERYRGIAQRIQNKPEMGFLRAVQPKKEKKKPRSKDNEESCKTAWEDIPSEQDEMYDTPFSGSRYRNRRHRPEFKERAQQLKRFCWKHRVPK